MTLSLLAEAIQRCDPVLLSTDLFDTVLLRDHTIESVRLQSASRLAATRLGVDPAVLTRLRWTAHDNAYRAVAIEGPEGDAALSCICETISTALGLGPDAARIMHDVEVDVDIQHLRPNRPLLELLDRESRRGTRVIAVSDTYYSEADLRRILGAVVGSHPLKTIYSSADLGLTKHAGSIFEEVSRREGVSPTQILHLGDSVGADVRRAQEASWTGVHLPRSKRYRQSKRAAQVFGLPTKIRRAR